MKVAKKVIGIVIAALLTVAFGWSAVNGVLILIKGLSITRIIYFALPAVIAIVGFVKALILLIRSFTASGEDYSYRKDCVRILKTLVLYFVITAICNMVGSLISTAISASGRSGASEAMIEAFAGDVLLGILMIVFSILSAIFIIIGTGKRSDDKPVRKVPLLIGVIFLLVCNGINNSFELNVVSTIASWAFNIAAILIVVLAFLKLDTKAVEVKKEEKEEVQETAASTEE